MLCTIRAFGLIAAVAVLAACAPGGSGRALDLHPCHLNGLTEEVQCGVFLTYEDRSAGRGRQISIHVAVLPAVRLGASPDPLVILAGGPGQGARSYAGLIARAFKRVRRTRAILLVDLRGTGDSRPLKCPVPADELGALAWTLPTTHVFITLSLARAVRLRRGIRAGWLVLIAEVTVFVPWVWYRLYGAGLPSPGAERFGWGLLAGMTALAIAFLLSMSAWAWRDERRPAELRKEMTDTIPADGGGT